MGTGFAGGTYGLGRSDLHSMVGRLLRVLVCSPRVAGWDQPIRAARWKELGFHHPPDFELAQSQHRALCHELQSAGIQVLELEIPELERPERNDSDTIADLSLDAVYTHDASFPTDHGLIVMRMGKANRIPEGAHHASFANKNGIPIVSTITPPGSTEAGDMIWLDRHTLLIGHGYRTNSTGIAQMRDLLSPGGVQVLSAPLPHGPGPSACLHLMSLISLLDHTTAIVDLPWLAVETVELLQSRGFKFIEIDDSERETLACNVLSLGNGRLLAIEANHRTNDKLRQAGFDVRTFPGSEICVNGGGGPTCLTRPLLRA